MQIEMLRVDGRLVNVNSVEGKERLKWERSPGYNPDAPENQFPRMLYKAQMRPDGVASVNEPHDGRLGGRPNEQTLSMTFNNRCQMIVGSTTNTYEQNMVALQAALEQGWRKTQLEALARFQARQESISTEAAHRHHDERNMTELAKKEAAAADAASPEHVAEIPEAPRAKRKYTKRAKPAVA